MIKVVIGPIQFKGWYSDVGTSGSDKWGLLYGGQGRVAFQFNPWIFRNPVFMKEYARDKWPKRFCLHLKHEGTILATSDNAVNPYWEPFAYSNGYLGFRHRLVPNDEQFEYLFDLRGDGVTHIEHWNNGGLEVLVQFRRGPWTVIREAYAPPYDYDDRHPAGSWCFLAVHAYRGKYVDEGDAGPYRWEGISIIHSERVFHNPLSAALDHSVEFESGETIEMTRHLTSSFDVDYNVFEPVNELELAERLSRILNSGYPTVDSAYDRSIFTDAIENFRDPSVNLAEFWFGIKEIPEQVVAILGKAARYNATVIADLFLSWCYGLRPLPDDISVVKELANVLAKLKKQMDGGTIAGAREITWDEFAGVEHLRIRLKEPINTPLEERIIPDDGVLRAGRLIGLATPVTSGGVINAIADSSIPVDVWGLARNVWELLPFSFVFDWFCNVSGMLRWSENVNYARRLNIKFVEMSIKMYRTVVPQPVLVAIQDAIPEARYINCAIVTSLYDRVYKRTVPNDVTYRTASNFHFDHWWEAGALITVVSLGKRR